MVDPDVIIFAGGVSHSGSWLIGEIKRWYQTLSWRIADDLETVFFVCCHVISSSFFFLDGF